MPPSSPTLLAADLERRCTGVPAYAGTGFIACTEVLQPDRLRLCERCDDEITRRVDSEDARRTSETRMHRLQNSGISVPFVTGAKSLATVRGITTEHEVALAALRRWISWTPAHGNSCGILLRGGAGLGKTDMAEGAVRELTLAGRAAKYVNARTLAVRVQSAFRDNSTETVDDILAGYTSRATALWLALDDLGATKTTRFVADTLYSVLEARARDRMPTLIVTNYRSVTDLAVRLKPVDGDDLDAIRPTDRIEELCPNVVTLCGTSLRSRISRPYWDNGESL